ncbi:MAG TPA: type I DNA topoisomerase [Patescibacteria group bacterium]|jgi:DNA topoisomerase-1|nr:type I DNA topoisomerase [Patescibacteria group bacterium]
MAKDLIIVESPTKAKTISKFLDGKYEVEASFGHVRDLPKSKLSIDVEHNFEPQYVIAPKAKEIIAKLKSMAKHAPSIILATDEDREGEAISWHLVEALGLKYDNPKLKRIVFHEITKTAIDHALETPRAIDLNLVDAQQARRVLDRLVGYELSPFLWRKIRYGLSAGRVQSVAVRLIVEREREIQAFKAEEYWSIEAQLSKVAGDDIVFTSKLAKIDDKAVGKMGISSEAQAKGITADLKDAKYVVSDITKKEVKRNPSAPFITSTLQQEAARKLGFSAKQTMAVAQGLYEKGFITYMRTDSLNLAKSALEQAQEVILAEFGKEYGLSEPRVFTNKSKGAQEAHEAIRPTDLTLLPQNLKTSERNAHRLYDLIWKRTIASQMPQAIFDQTGVDIAAGPNAAPTKYTFRANGQVVKFDGFIRAYTEGTDEKSEDEIEGALPELSVKEMLKLIELQPNQHFTEPPPRYTDATLIKTLEAAGVGRPSTYAPTLTTIQDRGYVTKEDKKYAPTDEGYLVTDMLVAHFPEIVDLNFTSQIEEQFDDIAEGKRKWVPVIADFYGPFKAHLVEKEKTVEKQIELSDVPCPHCSKMMLIKYGRMGKFLACPEEGSKVTLPMPEEAAQIKELEEKTKGEVCPICGGPMKVHRGRFGFFLGCADYPKCKGIMKIWNKTGFKCPMCLESADRRDKPGDVVEKKSRGRGKPFWACTLWPDCTLILNVKPESEVQLQELYTEFKNKPKDGKGGKGKAKRKPAAKKRVTKKSAPTETEATTEVESKEETAE